MSRTEKVARKVQSLLSGEIGRVGPVLFNPACEYVIDAVIIDGTAYKNTVVARRFQLTFFESHPSLRLTLSQRIYNLADPSKVTFFGGKADEMALQIATTLTSSGVVAELLTPYTLCDFLNQYCPGGLTAHLDDRYLFELSCATFMVGATEEARAGFRYRKITWDRIIEENGRPNSQSWEDRYREATHIAALLDGSDIAIREHILENVARNRALLGFLPCATPPNQCCALKPTPP